MTERLVFRTRTSDGWPVAAYPQDSAIVLLYPEGREPTVTLRGTVLSTSDRTIWRRLDRVRLCTSDQAAQAVMGRDRKGHPRTIMAPGMPVDGLPPITTTIQEALAWSAQEREMRDDNDH